jgi:membrane fusion protein (multidrug efflux system)
MFKKILTLGGLLALIAIIVIIKVLQIKALIAAPKPVENDSVSSAPATELTWNPTINLIGDVTAVQGVTLAAELDGKIVGINVESGARVKAGDILIQQDVTSETAQLRSLEAASEYAKITLKRQHELLEKQTISQADLDNSDSQYKQSVAAADNIRATIAKKTIRAPFDGRVGIRLVNVGQVLKAGDQILPLQQLDPIYVNFLVPQQRLSVLKTGISVKLTSDSAPDKSFTGTVTAIDPNVDPSTRNVKVQATLKNEGELLRPGMFVNVEVALPQENKVIAIPTTAILYAPYGDSVFIVDKKKNETTGQMETVARQSFVQLGESRGDFVAVTSGLKPGEEVVTAGVFKLRNGVAITVHNEGAPVAQIAPKPNDT